MIVAVFTGSRKWTDRAAVVQAFEYVEQHGGFYYIVTGDQYGLDRLAYEVALQRGHGSRVVPVHAFWKQDGRGAGNVRNGQMISVAMALANGLMWLWGMTYGPQYQPPSAQSFIRGFAFPDKDSVGTWNCVDDMVRAGIEYENRGTSDRRQHG